MKALILAAGFFGLAGAAFAQAPPAPPAPPSAPVQQVPSTAVYSVQLTDPEIEALIQMGDVCLKSLGYNCAFAFELRGKLQQAKQMPPRPAVPNVIETKPPIDKPKP